MTDHLAILSEALTRLQRPIKKVDVRGTAGNEPLRACLCTECGRTWLDGAPEEHWPTCATGIARAALASLSE